MEKYNCGLTEHTHTEECYAKADASSYRKPVCTLKSLNLHEHDKSCYNEKNELICGYADFVVHTHDKNCYNEDGELWCPLPKIKTHTHDKSCYEQPAAAHTHTDECYTTERGKLICTEKESEGHTHSAEAGCYDEDGELICKLEESSGHQHTDKCYEQNKVLTCKKSTEATEDAQPKLICKEKEIILHKHKDSCFNDHGTLICGKQEVLEHVHSDDCFQTVEGTSDAGELICSIEEHTHTDKCKTDEAAGISDSEESDQAEEEELPISTLYSQDESNQVLADAAAETEPTSIYEYANGKEGASIEITVSDPDTGAVIEKDEDGRYHVNERQSYNVRMTFASTNGMEPGTYYFELPKGQTLNSTSGTLMMTDRTTNEEMEIGTWSIETVDGTPRMVFNISDEIKNYTNITLTAITQVRFQETKEPLNVGSDIKFQVVPTDTQEGNELSKWANEIQTVTNEDGTTYQRIQWRTQILVHNDTEIVGKTVTDTIEDTSTHYFSDKDIANGLQIEATDPDTGVMHRWTVHAGDPGLNWTENGWTYTIPETITCERSGDHETEGTITLGNRGWKYYFRYTSTIRETNPENYVTYKNKAIGPNGETDEASTHQGGTTVGGANAVKTGSFNEEKQSFDWNMSVTIPAAKQNEKYIYYWFLSDELSLRDAGDHDITEAADAENKLIYNDALRNATVTAVIDGETVTIPNARNATGSDPYCWEVYSNSTGGGTYPINIYGHCTCTEDTCQVWKNGKCADKGYSGSHGKLNDAFCRCWCATKDVTFTFHYSVEGEQAQKIIAAYGGQGDSLRNKVTLRHKEWDETKKEWSNVTVDDDRAHIPIPGTFTKTDTSSKDDKTVTSFEITMNGEKQDLSQADGGTVTIVDTMSQTLLFMPDSLQITAEGRDDKVVTLEKDKDYTLEYNNSDEKHTVTVKLLHPGAYKYVMTYNAIVYIPAGSKDFTYSNTASVELFGKDYTDEVKPTDTAQTSASGEQYNVTLKKVDDANQTKTLSGATFGVYSSGGTKLTEVTTGDDGTIQVKTDTSKGIVFLPHTLYYFQEITPPEGYQTNTQKYWFWFCNKGSDGCKDCPKSNEENKSCLSANGGTVTVTDKKIPTGYELPETGGSGTTPYTTGGLIVMIGAGMLLMYRYKKRGKEDSASS